MLLAFTIAFGLGSKNIIERLLFGFYSRKNLTDEELQEMIEEADCDGDNEVSQDEFLKIMKKTSLY